MPDSPTTARIDEIKEVIKAHIQQEFFTEDDDADLTDTMPLLTAGVLDSIAILSVVGFLEERFGVALAAHEMSVDQLDSVADIAALVQQKLPR